MTSAQANVDNIDILRRIITRRTTLLLDFDGPICSVFSKLPPAHVATQLLRILEGGSHSDLLNTLEHTTDPFEVLRNAAALSDNDGQKVESALRHYELEAVTSAQPTPGAHIFMQAWHETGRKIAIVSNNSKHAIQRHLDICGVAGFVDAISARTDHNIETLKPSPTLLLDALSEVGATADSAVMVGDSNTDVQAAYNAEVTVIGYANKPGKVEKLEGAGANAIVTHMRLLAMAVDYA